jgi:hypothetical protein
VPAAQARVPWVVHAENIAEPATGLLSLRFETELSGPPSASMAQIIEALRSRAIGSEEPPEV